MHINIFLQYGSYHIPIKCIKSKLVMSGGGVGKKKKRENMSGSFLPVFVLSEPGKLKDDLLLTPTKCFCALS